MLTCRSPFSAVTVSLMAREALINEGLSGISKETFNQSMIENLILRNDSLKNLDEKLFLTPQENNPYVDAIAKEYNKAVEVANQKLKEDKTKQRGRRARANAEFVTKSSAEIRAMMLAAIGLNNLNINESNTFLKEEQEVFDNMRALGFSMNGRELRNEEVKFDTHTEWYQSVFGNAITAEQNLKQTMRSEVVTPNALIDYENQRIPASRNKPDDDVNRGIQLALAKRMIRLLNRHLGIYRFDLLINATNELTEEQENMLDLLGREWDGYIDMLAPKVLVVNYKGEDFEFRGELLEQAARSSKYGDKSFYNQEYNDFLDFVFVRDYEHVLNSYSDGIINISRNNLFESGKLNFYIKPEGEDEAVLFNLEKMPNAVDLIGKTTKYLFSTMPSFNYSTGAIIEGKYMDHLSVWQAVNALGYIDLQNNVQGFKSAISDYLANPTNNNGIKATLYSLYKNLFETNDKIDGLPLRGNIRSVANIKGSESLLSAFITELNTVENKLIEIDMEDDSFVAKSTDEKATLGADIKLQISIGNHISRFLNARNLMLGQFNLSANNFEFEGVTRTGSDYSEDRELKVLAKAYKMLLGVDILNTTTVGVRMIDSINAQLGTGSAQALRDGLFAILNTWQRIDGIFSDSNSLKEINALNATTSKTYDGLITVSKDQVTHLPKVAVKLMAAGQGSNTSAVIFKTLANAAKEANGEYGKATVMNLEGNSEARFTKRNMAYTMKNNFQRFNRISRSLAAGDINPFSSNFFVNNPNNLKSVEIRSAIKGKEEVRSNVDANIEEHIYQMLDILYGSKLASGEDIYMDFTNFSDKKVNYMVKIASNSGLSRNTDGSLTTAEESFNKLYTQNKAYYEAMAKLTIDKYSKIIDGFSELFGTPKAKIVNDANIDISEVPKQLREILTDTAFSFKTESGQEFKLTGWNAVRQVADLVGVELIHLLDYQGKTEDNKTPKIEDLSVADSFIEELSLYRTPEIYKQYMQDKLDVFAEEMKNQGVNKLSEFQCWKSIGQHYREAGSEGYVYKLKDGKKEIHPFISKFFYEWNIVSSSIMQATVGNVWQHKGKSKSDKLITQTKRNVAFTAQYMKYVTGNKYGVNPTVRMAQMADFTNNIKPIANTEQTVTCLDGATLIFANYWAKIRESFGREYAPTGGIDQKSFYSSMDPNSGVFTIIKHAAFSMTPAWIKMTKGSDIDLLDIHKKILSEVDLSDIDITKSSDKRPDGSPLNEFKGLYFYDEVVVDSSMSNGNDIYSLDKIDKTGRNYTLTVTNQATGEQSTRKTEIRNMYELWQALGGERTLSESNSKTAYKSGSKYFKQGMGSFIELNMFESLYDGGIGRNEILLESVTSTNPSELSSAKIGYNEWMKSHGGLILEEILDYSGEDANIKTLSGLVNRLNKSGHLITKPYQPLKGKAAEMLSFGGTIKAGTGLINSPGTISKQLNAEQIAKINEEAKGKKLLKSNLTFKGIAGINKLHTIEQSHNDAGMQVNTEHHIDHAELSIPKQMLNATSFGGKTIESANMLFKALASMVESSLEDYFRDHPIAQGLKSEELRQSLDEYQKAVIANLDKSIKKKFKDSEDTVNIQKILTESFDGIPIDSSYLKNEAITDIISSLSKKAMKIKMPGLMAVINPTARMIQIHEVIGGILPVRSGNKMQYIELPQDKITRLTGEKYNNWLKLASITADSPGTVVTNKGNIKPTPENIDELSNVSRELKGPELKLLVDGEEINISILDKSFKSPLASDRAIFSYLSNISDRKLKDLMDESGSFIKSDNIERLLNDKDVTNTIKQFLESPEVRQSFKALGLKEIKEVKTLKSLNSLLNYLHLVGNDRLQDGKDYDIRTSQYNMLKRVLMSQLDNDLMALDAGNIPALLDSSIKSKLKGKTFKAFVKPGEIVMPPIFRDRFGIVEGDDISAINQNFFENMLKARVSVNDKGINGYSVVAINDRGNHVYMFADDNELLKNADSMRGKALRPDENGMVKNDLGDIVTILGPNVLNAYLTDSGQLLISLKGNNINEAISSTIEGLQSDGIFEGVEFRLATPDIADKDIDVKEKARQMMVSFNEYLKATGARIPGQHFQSFQSLEIVDFIEDKDAAVFVPDAVTLMAGSKK